MKMELLVFAKSVEKFFEIIADVILYNSIELAGFNLY